MTRLTHTDVAERVGRDFTTISRLRAGTRGPSLELFVNIITAFNLDANEVVRAYTKGPAKFAEYLNNVAFQTERLETGTQPDTP